jgi:hypothetical protein
MPTISNVLTTENATIPITTTPEAISTDTSNINNLVIGDTTLGTSYTFPNAIGTTGQILIANANTLIWGSNPPTNVPQAGQVTMGSTDDSLILQSAKGTTFIGGIEYQYNSIILNNDTLDMSINNNYYFIEIVGSGDNTILLPDGGSQTGKKYIISKGYDTGSLTISTQPADKIDGDDTFVLNIENQRVQLISSGNNRWMII